MVIKGLTGISPDSASLLGLAIASLILPASSALFTPGSSFEISHNLGEILSRLSLRGYSGSWIPLCRNAIKVDQLYLGIERYYVYYNSYFLLCSILYSRVQKIRQSFHAHPFILTALFGCLENIFRRSGGTNVVSSFF